MSSICKCTEKESSISETSYRESTVGESGWRIRTCENGLGAVELKESKLKRVRPLYR